jgi:hypothetical protein
MDRESPKRARDIRSRHDVPVRPETTPQLGRRLPRPVQVVLIAVVLGVVLISSWLARRCCICLGWEAG